MMRTPIKFDGQVAVVTGAGGGIGRAFALELGRRGASVLVNDYGGDRTGVAGGSERAEAVVAEIVAAGGRAAADATAVGSWAAARSIVGKAVSTWGRLDILVNNAGIALPGRITDHSDEAIDRALEIMLHGPYALVRSAWPIMEAQCYGRIINISSSAAFGIGANASYGTAKAGLMGLTLDTAMGGQAKNILVNAVLPTAHTRLTAELPDKDFSEWMRLNMQPEKVAQAAVYFLSRESSVTGRIMDIGGGRVARIGFFGGKGYFEANLNAEEVAGHLTEIMAMDKTSAIESSADDIKGYLDVIPWVNDGAGPLADVSAIEQYGKNYSG